MKLISKILLWAVWFVSMSAGVNLLGFALFAPVMASSNPGMGLSVQVFTEQLLAAGGGRGRMLALGAVCVIICIICRKALRHLRQAEADAKAEQLLADLLANKPPAGPYFLYLRAFETTRRLKAPLFLLDLATMGLNQLRTRELESYVSDALQKAGPLVALGHPGENLGAGRVTTSDETWMSDIAKLASNASGILLIPSDRPGTLWEIEHLNQTGLLSRTVFMMPPESRRFDWRSHWSQARGAMGELGTALPEYEELGMLFTLDEQHRVRGVESFSLFLPLSLRKSIRRLLNPSAQSEARTDNAQAIRKARRRAQRGRLLGRMNVLMRAGAIAVFVLVLIFGERGESPRSNRLPWSAFWDQFSNAALIEERGQSIAGEFDDSTAYQQTAKGLSAAQEADLRAEMIHAGFRRLDNTQLVSMYKAFSQLLERTDPQTCGAIARRTLPPDQLDRALLKLDSGALTNWLDMNREAAIAELNEKPFPDVSYKDLVEARDRFEQWLKPEELSRFQSLSRRGSELTLEEECWLAKKSYGAVSDLPDPHNLRWARLLEFEHESPVTLGLVTSPLEKLKVLPAFQQRAQGMSDKQVTDLFGDLVGKGAERLDDSTLLARFGALSEILEKADETTCEAITSGADPGDHLQAALEHISDARQAAFLDSQYRAAVAELQQAKPVALSKDEIQMASKKFVSSFSAEELARLLRKGTAQGEAAREFKCWIARKDFAAVTQLEEPYNRMWARNLAQQ